jgi:putative acetyltransferase
MAPDVSFFCVRDDADALVVVGALRHLSAEHGEIKSMHTAAAHRGRGYARAMLDHLLAVARERGYRQVSLETGSPEAFAPARALYAAAGFERCGPFGDYPDNGFSTFMTMELSGESSPLPKSIGAPATRALTGAGYISLESLAGVTEKDLAKLHGVGPKALRILKEELAAKGLSLG